MLWEVRLATGLPLPPLLVGGLVAAVFVAGTFLFHALTGVPYQSPEEVFGLRDTTRNALFNSVFLGYAIGALGYGALSGERDLRGLGITVDGGPLSIPASEARRYRLWGMLGIGAGVLVLIAIQLDLGFPLSNYLSVGLSWFAGVTMLLCWVAGRAALAAIAGPPEALMRMIERDVDLLDLGAFRVLGRIALRNALLFIIGISLFVPFALMPGYAPAFIVVMAAALVVPTLALLLPLRGVRTRIRAARRAELARIDAALRHARETAAGDAPPEPGCLADLYAERAYVESVREWPFDNALLARFGLYLLIPLASWVGSALVERLVDTALQ